MVLFFSASIRNIYTSCQTYVKVVVLGSGGGVGQPLSMLLKLSSPPVTELRLYDIHHSLGVAADLSHVNTLCTVKGFSGVEFLPCALENSDIIVMTSGLSTVPGMSINSSQFRDELFGANAKLVEDLTEAIAKSCPDAFLTIITNPVNSLVPLAAGVLKKLGVFNPFRLFGVNTLDVVRSSTFVANLKGLDPQEVSVPCIGGHSGTTIVPVLSQCSPNLDFEDDELVALTRRIQSAGTEVLKNKSEEGTATLSMAYAAHRFVMSLCRGMEGERNVIECAYVSSSLTEAAYFASPLLLGRCGIKRWLPIPPVSRYEKELLKCAIPDIIENIKTGEKFLRK